MKIKALVPFSNGTLSMEQYQVAEVTDTLGNQLIAAGVAIEIGGGGTGGGVLVVTDTDGTLDKTWQEIHDAMLSGGAVISAYDGAELYVVAYAAVAKSYDIICYSGASISYTTDSASGYPTIRG